jgi:DNA-binding GntR family transcriptional regulator
MSIMSLNLAPGTAISEKEISLRYGVSRTPVREAFIRLSNEGLLKVFPQRETLVTRMDFKRTGQEFFLRKALEMAALGPFIRNCRSEHFTLLDEMIGGQTASASSGEYLKFIEFDDAMHRTIFEAAGEGLCWEAITSMCCHYPRVRLLSIWLGGIAGAIVNEHRFLVGALKRRDSAAAREALGIHLDQLSFEEKTLREEFPGYFAPESEDSPSVDFGGLRL